jgi:hypothetical protein
LEWKKTKKGMLNIWKFLFEVFDGKDDSSTFSKPTNSNLKTCKKSNIVNVQCLNKFLFVFPIWIRKNKERNAQHFEVSFVKFLMAKMIHQLFQTN